jgi:hypothetical protein
MRYLALGLLAAAGCNQIWGLEPVDLDTPGPDGPDGPAGSRFRLTAQITKTTSTGYVDPNLDFGPIMPPPAVQLGPLDASLDPISYSADGAITYPDTFVGKTWRVVYTLADGIPREVHWSPPAGDLLGHIVEPQFGRSERPPVPTNGGYTITPVGSPTQHTLTRVFTTGLWTEGVFTSPINTATVDYNFGAKAVSLSGPLGAPDSAHADYAVLSDFKIQNGCRISSGVAAFPVPDMVGGTLTPPTPQPTYVGADKQVRLSLTGPQPIDARLQGLLGTRAGTSPNLHRMEYGYTPSLGVFGFPKLAPPVVLDFYLPGPQMLTFANCTFGSTSLYQSDVFADPLELRDRFPRVVHVEVVNQRVRGLVTLTSGFTSVLTSSDYNFTSDFLVAAPINIRLLQNSTQIADLENLAEEPTPLPLTTGPLELVFNVEATAQLVADYFDITLYSIQPTTGALALQRIYTVTERKLTIDPTFLLPGTEYVFEVRAYRGRPDIARANFAINTYPQHAASIFTRTFKTPP